jgi:hypothetical protein
LPSVLLAQLKSVVKRDASAAWAAEAIERIGELCRVPSSQSRPASEVLADLEKVVEQSASAESNVPGAQAQIVRARYALARWLGIWQHAVDLDSVTTLTADDETAGKRIAECLSEVEALTEQGASGPAWRKHLELDELSRLSGDSAARDARRAVARRVLDRISSARLTHAQTKFVGQPPIAALATALRPWAAEPVPSARLLSDLDRYERTALPSDARQVARDYRALSWSDSERPQAVGKHLDTHYRNANVRVAMTRQFFNLLVPQPDAVESPFRDTVVDVPVYGRNTTFTELSVRLLPDAHRIRLGLEAKGLVASNSVSTSGPAKFYNQGQSTFLVRKLLVLGPEGLSVWPAVAEAENNFTDLVSVQTDYDGVPIVGSLVRNFARTAHDEKQPAARMELEQKVAIRARDQLDAEFRPRVEKAAASLEKKQIATLRRLGLELVPVGLSSTDERAVARARLSGPEQLGAHTPRPRAPSDSWLSLQVHQSALNNALERLELDGREFTLEELFVWISKKLDKPEITRQEDLPEDVRMKFASQDAVRLNCADNKVEVLLSFAELKQGSRRWRDFTVRAYYRPEAAERSPLFVRDTAVSVDGKGLKARPHLYAIFSKVLSRERSLRLLDESITNDPRLAGLEITQFITDHGWIGLAYSPRRDAPTTARRPK